MLEWHEGAEGHMYTEFDGIYISWKYNEGSECCYVVINGLKSKIDQHIDKFKVLPMQGWLWTSQPGFPGYSHAEWIGHVCVSSWATICHNLKDGTAAADIWIGHVCVSSWATICHNLKDDRREPICVCGMKNDFGYARCWNCERSP